MTGSFVTEKLAWIRQVAGDGELPPQAARLATVLAIDFMNSKSREAWPSVGTLANLLGVTPNTVRAAVAALERRGHLRVSPGGGRKNTSRYRWVIRPGSGTENTQADCGVSNAKPSSALNSFANGNPAILDAETLQSGERNPAISRAKTPQEIAGEPYRKNPKKEPKEGTPPSRVRARVGAQPDAADHSFPDADAYGQAFASIYNRWPKQAGEAEARQAFRVALASGVEFEEVAKGAAAYIADRQRDRRGPAAIVQYTTPMARWLGERGWEAWAALPEAERQAEREAATEHDAFLARARDRDARRRSMPF